MLAAAIIFIIALMAPSLAFAFEVGGWPTTGGYLLVAALIAVALSIASRRDRRRVVPVEK